MRLFLLLAAPALMAQPDPTLLKCAVAGTVVQETTGEALRQVEIGLVPVLARKPGQPPPAAIGVYSDSNGHFRIPELEPGVYSVRLRKEGFSSALASGSIVLPKLAPGQELSDLKLVMAPQAVLSGRVLDDNGDPVPNANLMLLRPRGSRGRQRNAFGGGFTTTDDRGFFRMAGIDPGTYLLSVDDLDSRDIVYPSAGALTAYATTYYPGVSEESQAQPIEVGRGTVETGLELRIKRVPVFPIRGRALGANGQPLARFTVNARRASAGAAMFTGSLPNYFVNGEFDLPGLQAGTWILTAVPAGSVTLSSAEIEVGSGPLEGVTLLPLVPQQINGTVSLDDADGVTPDWTQVGISISSVDGRGGGRTPSIDANGQFSLTFTDSGKAWLNIVGAPAPGTYVTRVMLGSDDVTGKELTIPSGGLPPLRIVFRSGAATLNGRAESTEPNVLAGRPAISLWPVDPRSRDARAAISTTVQPDGTFTMQDIRPGEYLVYAGWEFEPGPYGPPDPPEDLEAHSTRVKLDPGATQSIHVKLPRQGRAR